MYVLRFLMLIASGLMIGICAHPLCGAGTDQQQPDPSAANHAIAPDIHSSGWQSLIEAGDLSGWTLFAGTATFELKEGEIIGRTAIGSPSTFLCSKTLYSDFEMTFEVWLDDPLNSGVQIRSSRSKDATNTRLCGPQIEIEAIPSDTKSTCEAGYVFSEGTGRGWVSQNRIINDVFLNGQWNRFTIRAVGPRIQVWVNDRKVEDVLDEHSAQQGFIALQVHSVPNESPALEVRWRDLRVRELSP